MTRFFCDAMLGGLSRWLRALGYEADFEHGIDDGELVERAAARNAIILSSDQPLFDRKRITSGEVRALFVPRHEPVIDQAVFVLSRLRLSVLPVRCMECGGALRDAPRDEVESLVPPGALAAFHEFLRCVRCERVYWHGTHWVKIDATRERVVRMLRSPGT
jgi:uncharacterized protein